MEIIISACMNCINLYSCYSHRRMFYFFFESRNSTEDPVVIWLTGGPGCSSEMALFYENGPFTIANNLSLVRNEYGWDKVGYSDENSYCF